VDRESGCVQPAWPTRGPHGDISDCDAIITNVLHFSSVPLKHRNLGHTGASTFRLGAVMGATSVVGVALGVLFLGRATEAFVTQVLGLAMILAAVRIVWDIRHPHPAESLGIPEGA